MALAKKKNKLISLVKPKGVVIGATTVSLPTRKPEEVSNFVNDDYNHLSIDILEAKLSVRES